MAKDYVLFAFHPDFLKTFWTGWATIAFDYWQHNRKPPWSSIKLISKASSFVEIKKKKG